MKFIFRLESILNWKKALEQQCRLILAQKMEELRRQDEIIREIIKERLDKNRELEEKLDEGTKIEEYLLYKEYNEQKFEDLLKQEKAKIYKEYEVEKEKHNLIQIIKDRKILDKLRERKLKKFIYQEGRNNQKLIDELTIRKYNS